MREGSVGFAWPRVIKFGTYKVVFMCGVLGVVSCVGKRLSVNEQTVSRMRDLMVHRGPDGRGLWMNHHIAFAHRRLSIIDPEHGEQPFHLGEPASLEHQVLSFNGEIYNHHEVRDALIKQGSQFTSNSDTETLAHAWRAWGSDSLARLRGMFAFAVYEAKQQKVTLARDPMGIKPLYYAIVQTPEGREVVFASEPLSVLAHPYISIQPDWVTVSSYMTTIRTTLGHRSMYHGVHVLQPGEKVEIYLDGAVPEMRADFWYQAPTKALNLDLEEAIAETRSIITDSIDAHLISDVTNCTLLSGGIDSSIITQRAASKTDHLRTWCTGMMADQLANHGMLATDLMGDVEHAHLVADSLGTLHQTVSINSRQFNILWPWMISQTGLPLSTPNQVSIYQVASKLKTHAKVALSGEGADEIFAGYDAQLLPFARYLTETVADPSSAQTPLDFYLGMTSWVPLQMKGDFLNPLVMKEAEQDYVLIDELRQIFGSHDRDDYSLAHMMMAQRQYNLTGLLERLDSSTMLASVEGRTPFADIRVTEFADRMPMGYHFDIAKDQRSATTKRLLRHAFVDQVPIHVLSRPKASFLLPFQSWMLEQGQSMMSSPLARDIFQNDVMQHIATNTKDQWAAAWPMLNLSIWLESIWGSQAVRVAA